MSQNWIGDFNERVSFSRTFFFLSRGIFLRETRERCISFLTSLSLFLPTAFTTDEAAVNESPQIRKGGRRQQIFTKDTSKREDERPRGRWRERKENSKFLCETPRGEISSVDVVTIGDGIDIMLLSGWESCVSRGENGHSSVLLPPSQRSESPSAINGNSKFLKKKFPSVRLCSFSLFSPLFQLVSQSEIQIGGGKRRERGERRIGNKHNNIWLGTTKII